MSKSSVYFSHVLLKETKDLCVGGKYKNNGNKNEFPSEVNKAVSDSVISMLESVKSPKSLVALTRRLPLA